jgi:hypothetical protein
MVAAGFEDFQLSRGTDLVGGDDELAAREGEHQTVVEEDVGADDVLPDEGAQRIAISRIAKRERSPGGPDLRPDMEAHPAILELELEVVHHELDAG